MFWALAQWQKEKDEAKRKRLRRNAQAKAKSRAEGYAEGFAIGLIEGQRQGFMMKLWDEAQSEEEREFISRCADELGIALPIEPESGASII